MGAVHIDPQLHLHFTSPTKLRRSSAGASARTGSLENSASKTDKKRQRETDRHTDRARQRERKRKREGDTDTHTHERERESGTRDIRSRVHTKTRRRTGTHRHACNCVTSVHNGVKSMCNVCSQTLMSAALALLACLVPNRKVL